MARLTAIQWCDSTANPTMGCDGCELWNDRRQTCYAGVLHRRFGGVSSGYAPSFEDVTTFPGRMEEAAHWSDLRGTQRRDKPWLNGLPRIVFISDMGDSLSNSVLFKYLEAEIIQNVASQHGQRHCWMWLTKRPSRMAEFSSWLGIEWPDNLWVGTSIITGNSLARIGELLKVGNDRTRRFLSAEPQWEPLDLRRWLPHVSWLINGGESGPQAKDFHVEWAADLLRQCREGGVPYFLKQMGSRVQSKGKTLTYTDSHGGDWKEWPTKLRVREAPAIP
jgi:protein gp37